MTRLLMIDLGNVWGGQEIYSYSLIREFRRRGLVVDSFSTMPRFAEVARTFSPVPNAYGEFFTLARRIEQAQSEYDFIHFNGNRALYLSRLIRKRVPFIGTKHLPYRGAVAAWKAALGVRASALVLKQIDALICVCQVTYDELPAAVKRRALIIPNGVAVPVTSARRDEDAFTIVYAARLEAHKGILDALKAVQWLRSHGLDARFVIAGDGSLRRDVERFVRMNDLSGAVEVLGFTDRVGDLYARGSVCVLPSSHEGMPLNLLEAFSLGCPVVAYDIPGVNEVVANGVNGLLVRGGWQELAGALRRIASDPELQRSLARGALTSYRERFTLGSMVDRTLRVYQNITGSPAPVGSAV